MSAKPSDPRRQSAQPSKRASILPRPNSIVFDSTVLIAQHVQITGSYPITVGSSSVLHPHSKVSSALSPVLLGEGCVVYERAKVGTGIGDGGGGDRGSMGGAEGTVLGRYVVVESGASVDGSEVGEGSVIEAGASVGRGCVVGKFCTITASTILPPNTKIPDYTVVYGGSEQRIDKTLRDREDARKLKEMMHRKQLEIFRKLVQNNAAKWKMGGA